MEEQEIRFAESGGRRIAWARSGSGPPLVLSGWWMSHLEQNWLDPRFRAYVGALGEHRTVIRYDQPGTGASTDGGPPLQSVEEGVAALGAVIAAAGAEEVDLLSGSSGAPIGIAYAVAHPEAARTLGLYGGYATGTKIADARARGALLDLIREHWGLGSRALADVFMPSADPTEREAFVAFQRQVATPELAAASLEANYQFDVADRLGQVQVPTVVIHRREDRAIPFALGRELAAAIPGATLIALDGADHFPWCGDTAALVRASLGTLGIEVDAAPVADAPAAPAASTASSTADDDPLTARETEVLALVAAGLSDREIAERLVLSPHTVHRHVANVRTKLGLPSRAAAVAAAAKRGLL